MRKRLPAIILVLGLLVLWVVNLLIIYTPHFKGDSQMVRNSDVTVIPGPYPEKWYEVPLQGSKTVTGPAVVFLRNGFIEDFISDVALTNVAIVSITLIVWLAAVRLCQGRPTCRD